VTLPAHARHRDAGIAAPLRVLFVSTSYPRDLGDWRGLFIRHIVGALARRPEIALGVWAPPGELPPGVTDETDDQARRWLRTLMEQGGISHRLRNGGVRGLLDALRLLALLRGAYRTPRTEGLYHVNWLQNVLPLPRDGQPLVVTALGNDLQLLRLPLMRALLRRVFRHRRTAICPNAEWMVPDLERAFGDLALVRCVPFGIDARWYGLERRFEAETVPQWLCVSRLTRAKLGPLFEWTEPFFAHGRAALHLFGPMQEDIELPPWVHWHGPASPDELRQSWFPRAHGLISLSRHAEGRPQVMLEALASGLPIVASRLPAHDDLLAGGEGGVQCKDADAVVAALTRLSDAEANRALGARGRVAMRAAIGTWDDCAARYATLYRTLVEPNPA
jgi:hypothetical protein